MIAKSYFCCHFEEQCPGSKKPQAFNLFQGCHVCRSQIAQAGRFQVNAAKSNDLFLQNPKLPVMCFKDIVFNLVVDPNSKDKSLKGC